MSESVDYRALGARVRDAERRDTDPLYWPDDVKAMRALIIENIEALEAWVPFFRGGRRLDAADDALEDFTAGYRGDA